MADGRMLKKKISQSRKLAQLPSDSDRLFYTWLIPHLDVEGRILADPDVLKGQIVPRLKKWTTQKVDKILKVLADNELIILYQANGDQYLELCKFHDEQSLRRDREKKSDIPDPNEGKIYTKSNSLSEHPAGLQEDSRRTPAEVKLREVKLSQDKSLSKDKHPAAALPSKHFSNEIDANYLEPLLDIAKRIQGKSNGKKAFNFYQWIQIQIRKQAHPAAMIKAGNGLLDYWDTVNNPRGYLDGIMKVENANANERDWIAEHEKIKKEWQAWESNLSSETRKKFSIVKNI